MLRIEYDRLAKAIYIELPGNEEHGVAESIENSPGIVVDLDRHGRVIGVETIMPLLDAEQ